MNQLNVLTHHKCGSGWISQLISEFCILNNLTLFATPYGEYIPSKTADICLFANASYDLASKAVCNGIHIIRNPLDIIISAYYSHIKTHSDDGWPQLKYQREILHSVSIEDGLLHTLSFLESKEFYRKTPGPLYSLQNWDFNDSKFLTLKMEDVVRHPIENIAVILQAHFSGCQLPNFERYSFEFLSGRKIGIIDNNSHFRSGKINQWAEFLQIDTVEYMKANYNDILRRFYPDVTDIGY